MRIINFRPFLIIFAFTAVGVLLSLTAFFAFPLGIALLACLLTLCSVLLVYSAVKRKVARAVTYALALVVVVVTSAHFLTVAYFPAPYDGEKAIIKGRVTERYEYEDGTFTATFDEVKIDGETVDGKLNLILTDAEIAYDEVVTGYELMLSANVYSAPAIDETVNASAVRYALRYRAYASADEVVYIEPGQPYALEGARLSLRDHLLSVMGNDAGAVTYGMIAGDRNMLSDEVSDSFASAGIGHILAVSGLHIGLLATLLTRLLYRLPVHKHIPRALVTLALLAYTVFTGGSPSAVRALLMCATSIWAEPFFRYDPLNSVMLAGTVCLCISPYYLFECGFLMSMCAVLSLVCFTRPFTNALTKIKCPRLLASALATSASAQIGVLPITAYFFHRLYIYSLPVNAVMMSALGGLFTLLIATLPFSAFFTLPLQGVGLLTDLLIGICKLVELLPFATIVYHVGLIVLATPAVLFCASRFVMLPRKKLVNLALLALTVTLLILSENSLKLNNALVAVGGNDTLTVIYDGEKQYLFGDLTHSNSVLRALDRARIGGSFTVYTVSLDEKTAQTILRLKRAGRVDEVRFALSGTIKGVKTLTAENLTLIGMYRSDDVVEVAEMDGAPVGFTYTSSGRTAFITNGSSTSHANEASDIIRCRYAGEDDYAKCLTSQLSPVGYHTDFTTSYVYDFSSGSLRCLT